MRYTEPVMFEIAVQPTVLKYLRIYQAGEPIIAEPTVVPFGQYLWAIVQSEKTRVVLHHGSASAADPDSFGQPRPNGRQRIYVGPEFTERIGVGVHEFNYTRGKKLLNHIELQMFHNYVSFHLINSFIVTMDARPKGASINECIRQFVDRYDLADEDYSETALRKLYERYRSGKQQHGYSPLDLPTRCTPVVAAEG